MGWLADLLQELPVSAALKAKLEKKEAEYEALKRERDKLSKENEVLKKQVAENQQDTGLSSEETEILKVLAHTSEEVIAEQIAGHFKMHQTKVEHFMNELEEKGLVHASYTSIAPTGYSLSRDGKKLAVKLGFV
jgi:predicted transcriptional regulator